MANALDEYRDKFSKLDTKVNIKLNKEIYEGLCRKVGKKKVGAFINSILWFMEVDKMPQGENKND